MNQQLNEISKCHNPSRYLFHVQYDILEKPQFVFMHIVGEEFIWF